MPFGGFILHNAREGAGGEGLHTSIVVRTVAAVSEFSNMGKGSLSHNSVSHGRSIHAPTQEYTHSYGTTVIPTL